MVAASCIKLCANIQAMTVEQLQKPNVAAKLVTKFALTSDRRGRSLTAAVEPVAVAVTRTDELVVANAGDDSVLVYDVNGRLVRRVDQRELLQRQHDDDDVCDNAAAAGKLNNKLV